MTDRRRAGGYLDDDARITRADAPESERTRGAPEPDRPIQPDPDPDRNADLASDAPRSPDSGLDPDSDSDSDCDADRDRRARRARFLAELTEARELRRRVAPRRARAAELHARVLRTFRY